MILKKLPEEGIHYLVQLQRLENWTCPASVESRPDYYDPKTW